MEKFLHHGSVERVLHRGSIEDCTYLSLGIKNHNDSYAGKKWRSSYTGEVWKGSYTAEPSTIILIHYWVSCTIIIPGTRVEKFLHRGIAERVLYRGSMDDCANPLLGIEHHNDSNVMEAWRSSYTLEVGRQSYAVEVWRSSSTIMIRGIKDEKLLHCGCAERVLCRGSMDDGANLLLGIMHHNDSYAVEAWRSSYIVEVCKGSYTVEA